MFKYRKAINQKLASMRRVRVQQAGKQNELVELEKAEKKTTRLVIINLIILILLKLIDLVLFTFQEIVLFADLNQEYDHSQSQLQIFCFTAYICARYTKSFRINHIIRLNISIVLFYNLNKNFKSKLNSFISFLKCKTGQK